MQPIANILMIAAPKRMNDFMVACDLFERGKVLGSVSMLRAFYDEDAELSLERAYKMVTAWEGYNGNDYVISLVHLASIELKDTIIMNKGKFIPYWNKEVRIVSSGHKWFMLDEYIRHLGFKVKTDEFRFITEIS